MSNTKGRKSIKARAIDILALTTLIVAILSLGVSAYMSYYGMRNINSAKSGVYTFSISKGDTGSVTVEPAKGTLYYGLVQTKGTSSCKYTLSYRKVSASSYTVLKSGLTFSSNNKYKGEYKIGSVNGHTDYIFKMTKTAGSSTSSKVRLDWMLK